MTELDRQEQQIALDMNPSDEFYLFDVADDFYRRFPDYGWDVVLDEVSQNKNRLNHPHGGYFRRK